MARSAGQLWPVHHLLQSLRSLAQGWRVGLELVVAVADTLWKGKRNEAAYEKSKAELMVLKKKR